MIKSIFEMSFERKLIIRKIEDLSENIIEHILKYYLLDDNESRNHWIREITNKLYYISDMTTDRKHKLKFKDYYKILFEDPIEPEDSEYLDHTIERIGYIYDANLLYNRKELYNRLKEFYKILCVMFTERFVSIRKINELVKEYFDK